MNKRELKRKERLDEIKNKLIYASNNPHFVSYDKLIGEIVFKFGIDGRRAKEDVGFVMDYLELYVEGNKICEKRKSQQEQIN